ncbi:MAG TPA: uracil-DNA glycosylase, partial [Blastocatellia bacterium]|nr:uracil-DNA glycosylase [Blastocatellia bacterium]
MRFLKIEKNKNCRRCPYFTHAFVPPVGPKDAEVVLVGENPGRLDARENHPFVGDSGQILDEVLQAVDLNRNDTYITFAVKCARAENEDETNKDAIEHCRNNFLTKELLEIKPNVIAPMGNVA